MTPYPFTLARDTAVTYFFSASSCLLEADAHGQQNSGNMANNTDVDKNS